MLKLEHTVPARTIRISVEISVNKLNCFSFQPSKHIVYTNGLLRMSGPDIRYKFFCFLITNFGWCIIGALRRQCVQKHVSNKLIIYYVQVHYTHNISQLMICYKRFNKLNWKYELKCCLKSRKCFTLCNCLT